MIIREILPEEQTEYNKAVNHPLQSWQWGEFKAATGIKVIRLGKYNPSTNQNKLETAWQLFIHSIPGLPQKII